MRRFLWPFLLGLMVSLGFGLGVASGAIYLHTTTVSVQITSGVKDVAFYEDGAASVPWFSESISMETNDAWLETRWLGNLGSSDVTVNLSVHGNTGFGMVLFAPAGPYFLASGEVLSVEVTVYALPTAVDGNYGFTIAVEE